ncbi:MULTISPECIES: fimbria/pilus outer membrane usher protein [Providencia]|uniref:fimbria/pilus outer membrane usher protein n=1 Tax=Providencia TaxID=586 RepID=UPI000CE68069|nr:MULTISPECIES: fimbria/pilus outer membrane usher protein [Providencia]AVE43461.1 fimbrial biogenesis outer membrane usher protein [Providencia stuartii]
MNNRIFILKPISIALMFCLFGGVTSAEPYFDPALLNLPAGTDKDSIDLSVFARSDTVAPGRYIVTMKINKEEIGQKEIYFTQDGEGNIVPEFTPAMLEEFGVNIQGNSILKGMPATHKITSLSSVIENAQVQFDVSKLTLNLNIPQISMNQKARGAVPIELLDQGLPGLILNYQVSGSRQEFTGGIGGKTKNNSIFANITGGLNLGAWRLRSQYFYLENENKFDGKTVRNHQSDFNNTTVSRDIQHLSSEIVMGETSTLNDVLDSVPVKGVRLLSNEQMLARGDRGFAPQIRGVASSNSRITISQNGNTIYQTYVAPGPFVINDLYPTGTAGDLEVSIHEEDGSVRVFTQAFSSLPVMQRAGTFKYEVAAGQYNGGITDGNKKSNFLMGTLIYGLPKAVTLYTGFLGANHYWTGIVGTGFSLGSFGAMSIDATHAYATIRNEDKQGQSFRLRYSKNLSDFGTSIDLTALRYSTKDYYSFSDFNHAGYRLKDNVAPWLNGRQRSSFQSYINQSLGKWGSIYFRGMRSDYWGRKDTITTLGIGYSGFYKGLSYGIDYSISRTQGDGNWPENRQISFNVSVPFSLFSNNKNIENISSSFQISHDNSGRTYQQLGVNGQLLDNKFTYQLSESGDNRDQKLSSSVNVGYQGSKGYVGGGYSYSRESQLTYANGNGAAVIHPGGVTLGQFIGNSAAVVYAPDAAGASINNGMAVINSRGYAIVPNMMEYSQNIINLDINTLPTDVESKETSVNVYPTKGALVKTQFNTLKGYQAMLTLTGPKTIPMGAVASLQQSEQDSSSLISGIVGENGRVYISGLPEKGTLSVVWGRANSEQCQVPFDMSKSTENTYSSLRNLTVTCQ